MDKAERRLFILIGRAVAGMCRGMRSFERSAVDIDMAADALEATPQTTPPGANGDAPKEPPK